MFFDRLGRVTCRFARGASRPYNPPAVSESDVQTIEFHAHPSLVDAAPRPYPASRAIPEWFRAMPTEHAGQDTVKRCMPFLDAMTSGYIIPLQHEVKIGLTGTQLKVEQPTQEPLAVQIFTPDKFPGAPFPPGMPALKFHSPWVVKTPPGYSTLFVAPFNRIELPLLPLSGIVDTDTFYIEVTYPALCLLQPGQEFVMPRGTPLVQAIPFKRDAWQSAVRPFDEASYRAQHETILQDHRFYRDRHWQKKSFT
jgi:hypothetical protein